MTDDRAMTGLGSGKAQPDSAGSSRPPATDKADNFAELSRRLGERAPPPSAVDPVAAKAARHAALAEYDLARARRLRTGLAAAVALVVAGGIIAYLVPTPGSSPDPSSASAAADPEPAPPVETATTAPAPASPDQPSPSPPSLTASVPVTPAVAPAAMPTAPSTESQPAPAEPAPNQATLRRDEIKEAQVRLLAFGFNPGPVDGVPGPMTEDAVMHYQRHRGQQQTGTVDRQLLEQLRQDPAPPVPQQVAQRAARPDGRATRPPEPRRSDPFDSARAAGNRLGRWLDSLMR